MSFWSNAKSASPERMSCTFATADAEALGVRGDARHRAGNRVIDAVHGARGDGHLPPRLGRRCRRQRERAHQAGHDSTYGHASHAFILPALSRSRCRLSAVTARLGVDIGGTFTDLVVIDETSGAARVDKVLTTPKDPAHAVEQGIGSLLEESAIPASAVRAVVHGTTLATNALIERKGARTALLTTEGFRDALEIRHEGRYDMYDLFIDPPAPLVPRRLR